MAELVWVDTRPTLPGYYWLHEYMELRWQQWGWDTPKIVEVVKGPGYPPFDYRFQVWPIGWDQPDDLDTTEGRWAGPLEPPSEGLGAS